MKQHIENTKHVQWEDGMFIMLSDLHCDYELALIENSLRSSIYFELGCYFTTLKCDERIGVVAKTAGCWHEIGSIQLTREQALYIATGDTETSLLHTVWLRDRKGNACIMDEFRDEQEAKEYRLKMSLTHPNHYAWIDK
tara:strand:- start:83 stop:499 length:417 start_codon:yes stop_codon:yes gene_type:complete